MIAHRSPGRRLIDEATPIYVHPLALSAVGGLLTLLMLLIGWLGKNKIEDVTYELRDLRQMIVKQNTANATTSEWRNQVEDWHHTTVQWRAEVNAHVDDLDKRITNHIEKRTSKSYLANTSKFVPLKKEARDENSNP